MQGNSIDPPVIWGVLVGSVILEISDVVMGSNLIPLVDIKIVGGCSSP